jgi:hypothetical protein
VKPLFCRILCSALMAAGCSRAEFLTPDRRSQDYNSVAPYSKFVECDLTKNSTQKTLEVSVAQGNTPVVVSGQFCLRSFVNMQSYHIALAIDNSASMRTIDPVVAGTCKRHKAAQVLFKKLKTLFDVTYDTNLEVSLWHFSDSAEAVVSPHRYLTPTELEDGYLTADVFCADDGLQTNYEDIFSKVQADLAMSDKQKQLFVLTDGFPTATNSPDDFCSSTIFTRSSVCATKGAEAAKGFLSLSSSSIKILFLEENSASRQPELEDYLKNDITGNPDNVKFASKTEDVESSLNELTPAVSTAIGKTYVDASSTGIPVNLKRFDRLDEVTWEYQLETAVSEANKSYNIDLVLKDEVSRDPVGVEARIELRTVP